MAFTAPEIQALLYLPNSSWVKKKQIVELI
jgi:hypothetical protein